LKGEKTMEQFFANLAAPMVGFVLLYFVINKNFESQNKLIEKIDKLADTIHELIVKDMEKSTNLVNTADDIKDMYVRIAQKQEAIRQQVEEINIRTKMCPNVGVK
jgi:seryl-tRNA synthetase